MGFCCARNKHGPSSGHEGRSNGLPRSAPGRRPSEQRRQSGKGSGLASLPAAELLCQELVCLGSHLVFRVVNLPWIREVTQKYQPCTGTGILRSHPVAPFKRCRVYSVECVITRFSPLPCSRAPSSCCYKYCYPCSITCWFAPIQLHLYPPSTLSLVSSLVAIDIIVSSKYMCIKVCMLCLYKPWFMHIWYLHVSMSRVSSIARV